MNELALFAGSGGGILGGKLLGWNTVCAVEYEPYPASVLAQRQNEGVLPPFPIWDDVRTFDGRPWKGFVDVVSGGFPCQDISPAGKGAGIEGERSRLWAEMLRIILEVEPEWILVENSAHLRTKGLDVVLKGLAEAGYNASWGVLSAADLGANHERERMWIVAHPNNMRKPTCSEYDEAQRVPRVNKVLEKAPYPNSPQCERGGLSSGGNQEHSHPWVGSWWKDTSYLDGMDDGVAYRVDRLKAIGNGQVPIVAATAFRELKRRLEEFDNA